MIVPGGLQAREEEGGISIPSDSMLGGERVIRTNPGGGTRGSLPEGTVLMAAAVQHDLGRLVEPSEGSLAVWRSIYQQESSSGRNTATSSTGAIGPGQIMPQTFREFARPGEDIHNPEHNVAVSQRIVDTYHRRYGGDPARVAVAYFSGPGNVAPEGSPTPWRRDTSDGRVRVSQYVAQVTGRMGAATESTGSPLADYGFHHERQAPASRQLEDATTTPIPGFRVAQPDAQLPRRRPKREDTGVAIGEMLSRGITY